MTVHNRRDGRPGTVAGVEVLWERRPIVYRAFCNLCTWHAYELRDGRHASALDARAHARQHDKATP